MFHATRRKFQLLLFGAFALMGTTVMADGGQPPVLQNGDVIAICGDSITAQQIYSVDMEDYFLMCKPAQNLRTVQFGWSGEQAPGFHARMARDVLPFHPTVATTLYGMNDGHYGPMRAATGKQYQTAQNAIVKTFKQEGVRVIVVGSSKCVDSTRYHQGNTAAALVYNKTLGDLNVIARKVATKNQVLYSDVYDATLDIMPKAKAAFGANYPFAGYDGVHPPASGHLVMAWALLKSLGCSGNIGTIHLNLSTNRATATAGHKVLSFQHGVATIKSSRYPFCFWGNPKDPNATTGIIKLFPFNRELNRFRLIVAGTAPAQQYTVTFGKASAKFSGAQLAAGINLASVFAGNPGNPFAAPFQKVNNLVRQQQNFEESFILQLSASFPNFEHILPKLKPNFVRILTACRKHDLVLAQRAADAVVPVQYTISVLPATP